MLTLRTEVYPVECVVRGYLAGSGWKEYREHGTLAGEPLQPGLAESGPLPEPRFTPATKAESGHDENISRDDILKRGLMTRAVLDAAEAYALRMFEQGQRIAATRGLILADTKYEMGLTADNALIVIDEAHTPDSSRFWIAATYNERLAAGQEPESLDKEFVRRMIVEGGYDITSSVHPGTFLTDAIRVEAARRYLSLFEAITGEAIAPKLASMDEIVAALNAAAA